MNTSNSYSCSKRNATRDCNIESTQVNLYLNNKQLLNNEISGKHSAYDTILSVIYKFDAERDVVKECLKTLTVLMTQQPDLLDDRGIALMITFMVNKKDNETRKLLLKWVKECCVMHEKNR